MLKVTMQYTGEQTVKTTLIESLPCKFMDKAVHSEEQLNQVLSNWAVAEDGCVTGTYTISKATPEDIEAAKPQGWRARRRK